MKSQFAIFTGISLCIIISTFSSRSFCQVASDVNTNGSAGNVIRTAVPFLTISPDARSGALGNVGAALSPGVSDNYWNPSKLAFIAEKTITSLSYTPWMRQLTPGMSLSYLAFAHKLDSRNSIGASVRYFNLGNIELTDAVQNSTGNYRPTEFSMDASLARSFGENFSIGLSLRYIRSNLSNGAFIGNEQTKAANAVATDISFYNKQNIRQFGKEALLSFGLDVSNIGTKMSYSSQGSTYFLPTNLRMGVADRIQLDEVNQFTFTVDLNKLLVPTPPIRDAEGNVISGRDDNRSVVSGIFGSFSDAPGGFTEEFHEISWSTGAEYFYNHQFALRAGYFYENPNKGNRQYLTFGAGYKYQNLNFDFSYLAASQNKSPLANTLCFTLSYSFAEGK